MTRAILTDIEGTTSSVSFVHDVLFPYARSRIGTFIREQRHNPKVAEQIDAVCELAGEPLDDEAVMERLRQWIDEDRKATPLKMLQGMIWKAGYETGDFRGHVYEDAVRQLRVWHASGIRQYVFSSGSVAAQKMLFGHTAYGDLTPLFSGYFDTTTGSKKEPAAYTAIAEAIGLPAREILFLSDIVDELDAARASGFRTIMLVRDRDQGDHESDHTIARSFDEIDVS